MRKLILQVLGVTLTTLAVGLGAAWADQLVTTTRRMTTSPAFETTPTLGNDGTTDLVVYTLQPALVGGGFGPADIWYQPLVGGAPTGLPVRVTSSDTDDQLNDVSGDHIVYTAYDSVAVSSGSIIVYQISTGVLHTLGTASIIQEPRIHGDRVVWREGSMFAAMVMYYELGWIPYGYTPRRLAGPVPPTFDVQIGSRFAVWADYDSKYDVYAYDFDMMSELRVTDTADISERRPATSGAWVVWEQDHTSIEAKNMDTLERVTVDNGASNYNPSIDGDLVTWESDVAGNLDIWLYRISTGESFRVPTLPTSEHHDQYLNDVFGNMVAYVDMSGGSEDVYVSTLTFNQPPVANAGLDQNLHPGTLATLNANGSSDPDGHYPLTYAWAFVEKPAGSGAELNDPAVVGPSFTPDLMGDYRLQLVVTDSLGAQSASDEVVVSTYNTAPVADAGLDQPVTQIGETVTLNGTESYDDEGDPITYAWVLVEKPVESDAELDDLTSPTPSFVADRHGTYRASLVVTDSFDVVSDPDEVVVSFENVLPVADAGGNQAVEVNETVPLDGSGSSDANNDPLTYAWSLASVPDGSNAAIAEPTAVQTSFVADLAGTYVVSLVVNDGFEDSDPNNMMITATSTQNEVIENLEETVDVVNAFDPGQLKNKNLANALTNKLAAALALVDAGEYQEALDKLTHDVLGKTNGCAEAGAPDKNDWVQDCAAQAQLYPLIVETMALLEELI